MVPVGVWHAAYNVEATMSVNETLYFPSEIGAVRLRFLHCNV